jgi:hypothetical protein
MTIMIRNMAMDTMMMTIKGTDMAGIGVIATFARMTLTI